MYELRMEDKFVEMSGQYTRWISICQGIVM